MDLMSIEYAYSLQYILSSWVWHSCYILLRDLHYNKDLAIKYNQRDYYFALGINSVLQII